MADPQTSDIRIGVAGCAGRMGQAIIRQVRQTDGAVISGGIEPDGHPTLGQDLGTLAGLDPIGVAVTAAADKLFQTSDVVIEFSVPEATVLHAGIAAETGTGYVAGTTGLDSGQQVQIEACAARAPIVQAANFSLGINVLLALTEKLSSLLNEDFDIEVLEMHHRDKVDAPSGTALALGRAAAIGRGVELDMVADRGRDGITGARRRGDIGFAVLRGGNVAGDHTVVFAADDERIELSHRATDRAIFARGAVQAALWVAGKPPRLYGMADILDI